MRLTQKQELFTQNLFKGMTQREAWIQAGYSSNYPVKHIDKHACELANLGKVKGRYAELNKKLEDEAIAPPKERKTRLSTILRAPLPDGAVTPTHILQATDLLNKMDKLYSDGGGNTYNDIRVLIVREKPKEIPQDIDTDEE